MVAGALALLSLAGATPMTAQQAEARDCRCVDASGNEIENCTCFRTPRIERLPMVWGEWSRARARIGVSVDPEQGERYDADGARVRDVLEDGPADRAGVRAGDVITSLDGHELSEPLDEDVEEDFDLDASIPVQRLLAIARELEPDTEVEVELLRNGERVTLTVEAEEPESLVRGFTYVGPFEHEDFQHRMEEMGERLGELGRRQGLIARGRAPEGGAFVFSTGERFNRCPGGEESRVWMMGDRCVGGLELVTVNPELGGYFGATEGVLVTAVHEESQIGLEPGDVILAVGDREVDSPDRVRRILGTYDPEELVSFRILRNRTEMSVSGRLAPQ